MQRAEREHAASEYFAACVLLLLVVLQKAFYYMPSVIVLWAASRATFRESCRAISQESRIGFMHFLGTVLFVLGILATIALKL